LSREPVAADKTKVAATPLYLTFDDNKLLSELFGRHDENLVRIESQLGVTMTTRGNQVAINGAPESAAAAREVLSDLYEMLKAGHSVAAPEVDASIRMVVRGGGQDRLPRLAAEDGVIRTQKRQILPRSPTQAAYVRALNDYELVFAIGPAGTGKTYLAVAVAAAMIADGTVDRLVLSRPAVEAGEKLGFLPGDLREKVDPYLRPLYDALFDVMPGHKVHKLLETGEIEVAPLAFMRGRTLSNAFVILDEAQNTTPVQMKMFLTRLGEGSRMVVTGDLSQVDLPPGVRSGLTDSLAVLEGVEGIETIGFTDADVVRHGLVTRIVRAYEEREGAKSQ